MREEADILRAMFGNPFGLYIIKLIECAEYLEEKRFREFEEGLWGE